MKKNSLSAAIKRIIAQGGVLVFFIMAFEIMIMISPFAFFFYSVFNPFFRFIDQYAALSWLTSFFFTHMILPPTNFLVIVRILGSVLFITGFVVFILCALQVYLGKIFKWGIASHGLYRYIRHPQYLALGMWGIGMCILWPRFIVLVSLSIMFVLYYFLAKDEEKRMLARFGESYRDYMGKTGMFIPQLFDRWIKILIPKERLRNLLIPITTVIIVLLLGFGLRAITLHSLEFTLKNNLTIVSILPEDNSLNAQVITGIMDSPNPVKDSILNPTNDYLGYLMPADYIMQGMIANTGSDFHLFKKHNTWMMITEWVLHPFSHLRNSPSMHMAKMHHVYPAIARRHHCPIGINDSTMECKSCPFRRVIIVKVDNSKKIRYSKQELFSLNVTRIPICYIDINTKTGEIVNIQPVSKTTAWEDVPTPAI